MIQKLLPLRIVVSLLAIFLAGGIAGGFVGARLEHRQIRHRVEMENLPTNVMDMLDARLDLNARQVEELTPVVNRACDELRDVFRKNNEDVTFILNKYYDLISPALDEIQTRTLEAMEAELRQKAGRLENKR